MTLRETIEEAVRTSMRAGDTLRTSTLRLVLSAAHNRRIEQGKPLDDDQMIAVISREAKQRRESIEHFRAAGRDELVAVEEAELAILNEFLPQQLTPEEVERLVRDAIVESGAHSPAEMGRVMGLLAPRIKGRADGRAVSDLVRRLLAGDAATAGDAGPGPVRIDERDTPSSPA